MSVTTQSATASTGPGFSVYPTLQHTSIQTPTTSEALVQRGLFQRLTQGTVQRGVINGWLVSIAPRDFVGLSAYLIFEWWWTGYSGAWAGTSHWHLAAALGVTALATGATSNLLQQLSLRSKDQRPFNWGFFVRQVLIGAVCMATLTEGFVIYSLFLPLIPNIGAIPAQVVRATLSVFFITPFLLNPAGMYRSERLWHLKSHSTTMRTLHRYLPRFTLWVMLVEFTIESFAYGFSDPGIVFWILGTWNLIYLRMLHNLPEPSETPSVFEKLIRVYERFYNQRWLGVYAPAIQASLLIAAFAALFGRSLTLQAGLVLFIGTVGASWAAHAAKEKLVRRLIGRQARVLSSAIRLIRNLKASGRSAHSIVRETRENLEIDYQRLVSLINLSSSSDKLALYEHDIRRVLGEGSDRISANELLNVDFPRLVYDYLERTEAKPSPRLLRFLSTGLVPFASWPGVFEDYRYGFLIQAKPWSRSPYEQTRRVPDWLPIYPKPPESVLYMERASGEPATLHVQPLTDADQRELRTWPLKPNDEEVDGDLNWLIGGGFMPGEYGYKLVSPEGIEAIMVLFNGKNALHTHLRFVNPLRKGSQQIRGLGRELARIAMLDAYQRGVPITTFPITPESQRSYLSLGYERLSLGGTHLTEMWVLWPDQIARLLTEVEDPHQEQLPPQTQFHIISVNRDHRTRKLMQFGLEYHSTHQLLYSPRIFKEYENDPEGLIRHVEHYQAEYFDRQDREPRRVFILDVDGVKPFHETAPTGGASVPVAVPALRRAA